MRNIYGVAAAGMSHLGHHHHAAHHHPHAAHQGLGPMVSRGYHHSGIGSSYPTSSPVGMTGSGSGNMANVGISRYSPMSGLTSAAAAYHQHMASSSPFGPSPNNHSSRNNNSSQLMEFKHSPSSTAASPSNLQNMTSSTGRESDGSVGSGNGAGGNNCSPSSIDPSAGITDWYNKGFSALRSAASHHHQHHLNPHHNPHLNPSVVNPATAAAVSMLQYQT